MLELKMVKTIRKPGCVKYLWDKRLIIYVFLAGQVGTLALCFYVFVFMMKPVGSYKGLQDTWGFVLLMAAGTAGITALLMRYQGKIQVNQTESKIEIFKGLGLNTCIHSLRFDTLEKIVLLSYDVPKWLSKSSGPGIERIGIYLKNGKEIGLPFTQLPPGEGYEIVKEIAETAKLPAFDSEGNPIHSLKPLAVCT